MNELSWLFYWGNVSSNLGTTGSLVLFVGSLTYTIIHFTSPSK
jgi:hypothetical protein